MNPRLLAPPLLALALTTTTGCPDPDEDGGNDEIGETEDTDETSSTDSDTSTDSTDSDSTDSDTSDTTDSTDSTDSDTTDTEGELGQHGAIKIELRAADPSVFDGTDELTALVSYGPCLRDFYPEPAPPSSPATRPRARRCSPRPTSPFSTCICPSCPQSASASR
ncbi:MAG: hypothetical protein HC927_06415 [Deltaproteobacteria bacterium]|nr:hypothetical protein [Deltaproteobacteria bacterium]